MYESIMSFCKAQRQRSVACTASVCSEVERVLCTSPLALNRSGNAASCRQVHDVLRLFDEDVMPWEAFRRLLAGRAELLRFKTGRHDAGYARFWQHLRGCDRAWGR